MKNTLELKEFKEERDFDKYEWVEPIHLLDIVILKYCEMYNVEPTVELVESLSVEVAKQIELKIK